MEAEEKKRHEKKEQDRKGGKELKHSSNKSA